MNIQLICFVIQFLALMYYKKTEYEKTYTLINPKAYRRCFLISNFIVFAMGGIIFSI